MQKKFCGVSDDQPIGSIRSSLSKTGSSTLVRQRRSVLQENSRGYGRHFMRSLFCQNSYAIRYIILLQVFGTKFGDAAKHAESRRPRIERDFYEPDIYIRAGSSRQDGSGA